MKDKHSEMNKQTMIATKIEKRYEKVKMVENRNWRQG